MNVVCVGCSPAGLYFALRMKRRPCGDAAAAINGQTISVSGGEVM